MTTTIKVPNREIAIWAFDYLRHERKTVPALRLAHHLLHHESISLGIGDTDWDIDTALQRYGGEPKTGYGHSAHFNFDGKTIMERADSGGHSMKRTDKLRAAERSLFSFINDMYGKRNPAVHR